MLIREELEMFEDKMLSPFAQRSSQSKGRKHEEKECNIRTRFQRDRDMILYSKSFLRLKHKTQVFLSPEGDHYRTRLTHTLEVSQIARTIARSLRLNEELTEAISLGHDLGHTPFGHAGEMVLNEICPYGFRHNEQSLRVVDVLERDKGLNLTWEVRDGIKPYGKHYSVDLEGQVVRYADQVAYINHDIDDAIRGGVICEENLPKECTSVLGIKSSRRINNMIINIIENSRNKDTVSMSDEFKEAKDELREFMFKNVYVGSEAKKDEMKAKNIIRELYKYIKSKPDFLSDEAKKMLQTMDLDRVVCDYIAGMTDRYAIRKFHEIFIPEPWH